MSDDLTLTRTFAAPPALVYAMWTTPEHFAHWFGTDAVHIPLDSVQLDARVGGRWTAQMHLPDGHRIDWSGEYTEVDPPARLAFTMNDDPTRPAGLPVVVTFREVPGGTEMTLVQARGGFSDEQLAATRAGYSAFFDVMEQRLEELTR